MEPLPETLEAVLLLNASGNSDLGIALGRLGRAATEIVPELVGLSLTTVDEGLTYTLVATDRAAELDVMQYLDDGPCLEAVKRGEMVEVGDAGLLSEERWHLLALAEAATGVVSSLSMPIHRDGQVVGGINLYASTANAFRGHQDALAEAMGATASDAVHNADLPFRTRWAATAAPDKIREDDVVHNAVGVLAATHDLDVSIAERLLREAAARAGVSVAQAASAFLRLTKPEL